MLSNSSTRTVMSQEISERKSPTKLMKTARMASIIELYGAVKTHLSAGLRMHCELQRKLLAAEIPELGI